MVAVMSSVAFLEALVNEVYLDAVDPQTSPDRLKGITYEAIAAMRDRWNATPSVEREGVLEKYKTGRELRLPLAEPALQVLAAREFLSRFAFGA